MSRLLLLVTLSPLFLAVISPLSRGDDTDRRKAESPVIELELVEPKSDATFEPHTLHKCRLNIECKDKDRVPQQYKFAFHGLSKLKLVDGELIGDTNISDDHKIFCEIMIKFPSHLGKYKLKVEPVAIHSLRKTEEEKVSVEATVIVAKAQVK